MNPKIQKLRNELSKNEAKIKTLQERNIQLRKQLQSMENTEIIGLIRSMNLDVDAVYALIQSTQPAPEIKPTEEELSDEA